MAFQAAMHQHHESCLCLLFLFMSGNVAKWEAESAQLQAELSSTALELSARRQDAAGRLRAAVEHCLSDLAMAGTRFDVRISWQQAPQVIACGCAGAWWFERVHDPDTGRHAAEKYPNSL